MTFLLAIISPAFAADYQYSISNNQVTITKYIGPGGAVTIPDSIEGYPVTSIGYQAFYQKTGVTSVVIPDGVTSIGDRAFYYCIGLTSVEIGTGVTSIGTGAFESCSGLTSMVIPNSVTSIGNYVFWNCTGLTSVVIPDGVTSIGDRAFYYCIGLTSVEIGTGVTSIGTGAFESCSGLTSMVIPNSVTSIGNYVFWNCTGLTSVEIGTGVTSIGDNAFYGCSGLTSITVAAGNSSYSSLDGVLFNQNQTKLFQFPGGKSGAYSIPDSVNSIGDYAFYRCTGLTSMVIPDSVNSIGNFAFSGCSGFTSVVIPNSVTSIGNNTFGNCSGLTSVVIPNSVTSIGEWAFYKCTGLASVEIEDGVTSIGNNTFGNCSGLTSVVLGTGLTSIGNGAFQNCSGLTSVDIPDSVTSIENNAFYNCTGLTSVVIPNSVTSIGYQAFYQCTGLTSVVIGTGVISIGSSAFSGCSGLTSVDIPNSVTSIGYQAFSGCIGLTSVTIGTGVTSIGSSAFSGCSGLTSVAIPDNVTSIESGAFSGCSGLTSVDIPNSVTSIGSSAFSGCTGLTSVVIPDSVTSIGGYVFSGCTGFTSVVIPNSVTSIGEWAFYKCTGLTSVVIPNSVTSIGEWAFWGCSGLAGIYFMGGPPALGYDVFGNVPGTVYYIFGTEGWGTSFGGRPTAVWKSVATFDGNGATPSYTTKSYNAGVAYGELPTASRAIHTFEGWWTTLDESGTLVETNTLVPLITTGHTLYAKWRINQYTISFDSAGGSAVNPITQDYNTAVTAPAAPTKTGYTFTGWNPPVPATMPAENKHCVAQWQIDYEYSISNNQVTITKYIGPDGAVTIPDSIEGYPVTSIGYQAFKDRTGVTSVVIPDGVTSIGNQAFYLCRSLASVDLPDGLTSIGNLAFSYCALTSVVIPNSVTSIGNQAFQYCSGLTGVALGTGLASIGTLAFSYCTGLASVVIPASVTSIEVDAFQNCSSLTDITVATGNSSYSSLDGVLFNQNQTTLILFPCGGSGACSIPASVTSIGDYAFYSCSGLASVVIPNSVTSIGRTAFWHCTGLTSVEIPDGVTSIGTDTFTRCIGLTSMVIPNSVTNIGDYAFSYCTGLASVEIPDSVTSIGDGAFTGCSGLTSVELPASVTSIGDNAFTGCSGLTSVEIPASVTSIGSQAFIGCTGLTSVVIPNSVTSIRNQAFQNCYALAGIYFMGGPPTLGFGSFMSVPGTVYYIYGTEGWGTSFGGRPTAVWTSEATFEGNGGEPSYTTRSYNAGVAYGELPTASRTGYTSEGWWTALDESGTLVETTTQVPLITTGHTLYAKWRINQYTISFDSAGGSDVDSITQDYNTAVTSPVNPSKAGYDFTKWIPPVPGRMPAGDTTCVAQWTLAFTYSENEDAPGTITLTKYTGQGGAITIPSSLNGRTVTRIGDDAFRNRTDISSVDIPDSVTSIGNYAFNGCRNLASVNIPDSVTSIGGMAFQYCSSLTDVDLPDGLSSIGNQAFFGCTGLSSVDIPDSVTSIGNSAFYGCTGLTNVRFGTGLDSIGNSAFRDCSSLASVDIPDNVTSIGNQVFYGCSSLDSVEIGSGVTSIGNQAFYDCSSLSSFTVAEDNTAYSSRDGVLFDKNKATLLQCPAKKSGEYSIPNSVTSVVDYAFKGCTDLSSVNIPNSVTSLGNSAFLGCSGLASVMIGAGLTSIGDNAFDGCSGLTGITVADDNPSYSSWDGVLFDKNQTTLLLFPAGKSGEYSIPDDVTSIGKRAFYGCAGLSRVNIPNSVTSIGNQAFLDCSGLGSVVIPASVTDIGHGTFEGCTSLSSVDLPDTLTEIGYRVFAGCSGLAGVDLPDALTKIGREAFQGCTGLTSVVIPANVTSIWLFAFDGCSGLTGVYFMGDQPEASLIFKNIPDTLTIYYIDGTVGWGNQFQNRPALPWTSTATFEGNGATPSFATRLYNVGKPYGELPEAQLTGHSFTGWWTALDANGTLVTTATLVPYITTDHTLYAKWQIEKYTISFDSAGGSAVDPITEDYDSAVTAPANPGKEGHSFTGWVPPVPATMPLNGLTCVAQWQINQYRISFDTNGGAPPTIDNIIQDYGTAVTAPAAPTREDYTFYGWLPALPARMPAEDTHCVAQWQITYARDIGENNQVTITTYNGPGGDVTIPDTLGGLPVTSIGDGAFADRDDLSSVDIPDSVTSIGDGAFAGCDGLSNVDIPDSVTSIGDGAFADCDGLTSVDIPSSVTSIGNGAFADCDGLSDITVAADNPSYSSRDGVLFDKNQTTLLQFPAGKDGNYSIPNSVESIGSEAFSGCDDLSNVVIPDSVTSIGDAAFEGCSGLAGVDLPDSLTSIGRAVFSGCSGLSSVDLPDTLTSIGDEAFAGCRGLSSVDLPDTLTSIGDEAFAGCSGLSSVVIPANVNTIGNEAFANCIGLQDIYFMSAPPTELGDRPFHNVTGAIHYIYGTEGWDAPQFAGLQKTVWTSTATFNGNGATPSFATRLYNVGKPYGELPEAQLTGHSFTGWWTAPDENGTLVTTATLVPCITTDHTLYAKWQIEQYTISFDSDGGTAVDSITQNYNSTVTAPANPSKEGYTFDRWEPPVPRTMPAEDTDCVAQWTINQYTISFDSNGGTPSTIADITQDYNTAVRKPDDPTKTGYTFNGWNPAVPERMPADNKTCVAQWTINQYTISFNSDGGSEVDSITQDYDTAVTAPANPTKEGYSFGGWNPAVPQRMPLDGLTCVAQWRINQYTISFDSQGGSAVDSITQDYDTAVTAPANPSKEGHTFGGWNPAVPERMPADNPTCVAQWTINRYTISFNSDGGSAVDSITQDYDTAVTAPNAPTKEGYTFNGWNPAVPERMPADNPTCVAQWTINRYTISFNSDGGSEVDSITQDYDTAVTAPANPTKTGYTFNGWNPAVPERMPADNPTCVAQWTINRYTISFDSQGGSNVAAITQDYNTAVRKPDDPTKTGYTFNGWNPAVPQTMPADNPTCVAQWTINRYTISFDS
ncbi:MAG: leucine-rich repeat protein, partial [Lentisphaeria bacterium]